MKTIIWDVDDTLNNFRFDWFLHNKEELKKIDHDISYDYFNIKNPYNILNDNKDTFIKSLKDFKNYNHFKITVNKEIYNWFYKYGKNYNHIILTKCSKDYFEFAVNFVNKYFGKWIQSYNYISGNKKDNLNEFLTKAEFIKKYFKEIKYFIDDSEKNCKQVEELGIKTFCPKQPWNNGMDIKDILEELNG